jgi:hypothetical protein
MNIFYNILLVVLWAPVSFLLHNAIHEGSHAAAVKIVGGNVKKIWLLPSYKLGYFTFGHVLWEGKASKWQQVFITSAPLIGETIWLTVFIPLATVSIVNGWIMPVKLILLTEVVSTIIDASVWALGWIRNRPHTDGGKVRAILFGKGK